MPLRFVACWRLAVSPHLILERLMRRVYGSAVARVLVLVAGAFLALMVSGCNDPVVAEIKAERRRMGSECEHELRQDIVGFPPATHALKFRQRR
jgi:hypothetical protein